MIEMILAFMLAWVSTLTGVALGGFLVYRTKRDSHEAMFQFRQPEGDSFNVTDFRDDAPPMSAAKIPDPIQKANDAFVQQFAESLTEKDHA